MKTYYCLLLIVAFLLSPIATTTLWAQDKQATPVRLFPFHEGGKEGRWGFIDANGKVVIEPRFRRAYDFEDGLAWVQTDKGVVYINAEGKAVFAPPDHARMRQFSEGLAAFELKDKWGFLNRQGKVIVQPKYDDVSRFSEGLAAVNVGAISIGFPRPDTRRGGRWGFIDKMGRLVVPIRFDWVDLHGFSGGLAQAFIREQSWFSYIDKNGTIVIRLEYSSPDSKRYIASANRFSEGLACVSTSGSPGPFTGFIDKSGKFVIEPHFHYASDFSEGLAVVEVGTKAGYVDRSGRAVVAPQFDGADDFSGGLAAVRRGKKWSFIDKRGKTIIPGPFNDVDPFKKGLARVHEGGEFIITKDGPAYWSGGEWFYINAKGEKLRRCCEDGIDHSPWGRESQ
jgi:hypothetical protein